MRDAYEGADDSTACEIARHTRRWIERFVVGLNLCPFAAPLFRGEGEERGERLRIAVCRDVSFEPLIDAVLRELELLRDTPADAPVTSVLVFAEALADFDDYLDFLVLAENLLQQSGLEGEVQIASFHPDYCFEDSGGFEGSGASDVANFTNRAPYPMLHFLREEVVARALEHFAAPERIPQRNIDRLRGLGEVAVRDLLARIEEDR